MSMISGNDDNIIAYRIVHVPDETKSHHIIHTASSTMNTVATTVPQQLQYIVIDNANGYVQAVPTTQITATVSNAPIKVEPTPNNSNSNSLKMRSSVAIAPKIEAIYTSPYTTNKALLDSSIGRSNVCKFFQLFSFIYQRSLYIFNSNRQMIR